jgi:hypothetical protein
LAQFSRGAIVQELAATLTREFANNLKEFALFRGSFLETNMNTDQLKSLQTRLSDLRGYL